MKKTISILVLLTLISKLIGFGKDIVLTYYYGASNITDAYIVALTVPTVIFAILGRAIATSYIPIYMDINEKTGDKSAKKYTNNLINIVIVICTILVAGGLTFTENIVRIFASGFEADTLILATNLTRITFFGVFFTAIVHILSSFLQIKENFIAPALVGLPMNIIVIASIVLSSTQNRVILLGYGIVLSLFIQLIFLLPFASIKGFRYMPILRFNDSHIKKMTYLAFPVILSVAVSDINTIVDRTLASQLIVGGISALNYANRLNVFIQAIVVTSIVTAMYPVISKLAAQNNMGNLKSVISESINSVNLLVMPASIGSIVLAEPIVSFIFGRGAFGENAVEITSNALIFYSIGMVSLGIRPIITRVFYSLKDTTTPMINATVGVVLNIILNLILSQFLGLGGLALATSMSAVVTTLLLFVSLRKKIGPFGMKQISISFLKILFASLVMGLISKLSFNYLTASLSQNLSLLLAIAVGAISYFVIIYFMKIEDVDIIVGAIKKKFGKGTAKG